MGRTILRAHCGGAGMSAKRTKFNPEIVHRGIVMYQFLHSVWQVIGGFG